MRDEGGDEDDAEDAATAEGASIPFLDSVKAELDKAGMLKGLPLLVFVYLLTKAL